MVQIGSFDPVVSIPATIQSAAAQLVLGFKKKSSHLWQSADDISSRKSSKLVAIDAITEEWEWQEDGEMQREAVEGMRRTLGEDHQDTLKSMENLANAFQEKASGRRQRRRTEK